MSMSVSSPAMKPELFQGRGGFGAVDERRDVMTVSGAVNATWVLLVLCVTTAFLGWAMVRANPGLGTAGLIGGLVAGLICAVVMMFKPTWSPAVAPVYALAQGIFVGVISAVYADQMAGTKVGGATGSYVVATAAAGTFAVLGVMLTLYRLGWIRATGKFKAVMAVGGVAIGLYFVAVLGMSLFGVAPAALFSGPIAIGITGVILVYASFCLIMDFDFIEQGAASGAPKYMNWYAGFALLATLVWIYLQILRLLSLLNRRD